MIVYCSTPQEVGTNPLSRFVFVAGASGYGHRGLEASPGLGQGFADTDGYGDALRAGPVAQFVAQSLGKLSFQEALLNDWLERSRKVLDTHRLFLRGEF